MCFSVGGAGSGGYHCKCVMYVCCSTESTFYQITLWVNICIYYALANLYVGKYEITTVHEWKLNHANDKN
jgi:hypothetical protein